MRRAHDLVGETRIEVGRGTGISVESRSEKRGDVRGGDVAADHRIEIGERLAIGLMRLKAQRRLTNKDLADQLGVSEAYMSQVTRGMRDVKLSTLDKMQREWNVTIEDLFKISESDLARIAAWRARRKKKKTTDEPT